MSSPALTDTAPSPRWMSLAGRILTGLAALFLIMDGTMKLLQLPVVLETTVQIGWPVGTVVPLGLILVAATVLYLVPRTSLLGAVLLTGYLGGAIATHARLGSPLFSHTLFGVYIGVIVWAGLVLRSAELRRLMLGR